MLEEKLINLLPVFFIFLYYIFLGLTQISIAKRLNIKVFKMFIPVYREYTLFKTVGMSGLCAFIPFTMYLFLIPSIGKHFQSDSLQGVYLLLIIIYGIFNYLKNVKMFCKIYPNKSTFKVTGFLYTLFPVLIYFNTWLDYANNNGDNNNKELIDKKEKLEKQILEEKEIKKNSKIEKETLKEDIGPKAEHRKVKIYVKKDKKKELKEVKKALKNKQKQEKAKNRKSKISRLLILFLTFSISLTSLFGQNAYALDFNDLDPNCAHENVWSTFNQAFPCELGNVVDDEYYTICQDCNGLIKSEKRLHKSAHGQATEIIDGVKICKNCGKPASEDVRYVKRDISVTEIDTIQSQGYQQSILEQNESRIIETIKNHRKILNETKLNTLIVSEGRYFYNVLLGEENFELKDLGVDHLMENEKCEDGCPNILISINQPIDFENTDNDWICLSILCPNCTNNKASQYEKNLYLDKSERNRMENNASYLRDFWNAIDEYESKNLKVEPEEKVEDETIKENPNQKLPNKEQTQNQTNKKDSIESKPIESNPQKYEKFIKIVDKLEELWYNQDGLEVAFYTTAEVLITMVAPEIGIAIDLVDSIVAGIIEAAKVAKTGASLGDVIMSGILKALGRFTFILVTSKLLDNLGKKISDKYGRRIKKFENKIVRNINKIIKPYKYYPKKKISQLPDNVKDSLALYIQADWDPSARRRLLPKNYKIATGKTFKNNVLQFPQVDKKGNPIHYIEHDVNSVPVGGNRENEAERFITGSDGSIFYTRNHYRNFIRIK